MNECVVMDVLLILALLWNAEPATFSNVDRPTSITQRPPHSTGQHHNTPPPKHFTINFFVSRPHLMSSSAHHPLGGSVLSPSSASPIYLCGCLRRARVNHSCISRPSFSPPFSFSRRTSAAGKTSGMHDPNTPPRATNAALASGSPVIQLSRRDFDIMREEHRGLREDNMFLRQQLSERLAVPPMPQHASASQTQTHGHATTMPARPAMTSLSMAGRGGPAAAPAAPAFQAAQRIRAMSSQAGPSSLRVHATSGTSFPTQRHASMKAASTASISVDEPVKVKLHNDRIYYIPWHKVGARVATPNFHEVLAQWCCVISSPSITGGSSGDDVWECLFTSLRPYQDDLLKYGFRWCSTNGSGAGHRLATLSLTDQNINASDPVGMLDPEAF
ncbi:hypothetical protein A4X03_0g7179 [Tilletia caries]|uniref:Uncharacterized protein n=1 Tax=Tilletia caries TaxID=13290 RepID=A0A177U8T9_9BASI|nr:hypothetical protein A4X03_0g7179 [Tilletia caries]